jgi:SAM-dependent methyltransferase
MWLAGYTNQNEPGDGRQRWMLTWAETTYGGNGMTAAAPQPDLRAIKGRQQVTWSSGDYARVGNTILFIAELLCESVDVRAGQQVLDVATGNGNAALAAARRFCEVTGIDYAPTLLADGRKRAEAEGLPVAFREGDAEALPFPDASFDVVLSTVGAMFAPDQAAVARELLRVCRPGGKIGMANWTPEGFIGALFRTTGQHVPPPAGLPSVMRWGDEAAVRDLFGDGVSDLRMERRICVQRFPSPAFYVDFFRRHYGPTLKAFEALDAAGQERLAADLAALLRANNRSGDTTLVLHSEYLEIVATRR